MSVSSQAVVGWIRKSEVQCQYSSSNSGCGRYFFLLQADKEIIKHT